MNEETREITKKRLNCVKKGRVERKFIAFGDYFYTRRV